MYSNLYLRITYIQINAIPTVFEGTDIFIGTFSMHGSCLIALIALQLRMYAIKQSIR
jgi:hypothetical protein